MLNKLTDKKGFSSVLLIGFFLIVIIMVNFCVSAEADMFRSQTRLYMKGLKSATKAALLMTQETEDMFKGYLTDNIYQYNQCFRLDHEKAIETFYEKYCKAVNGNRADIETSTNVFIVEPYVKDNQAKAKLYSYRNGLLLMSDYYEYSDLERIINQNLSYVKIKLFNNKESGIVNMEFKTYFIAVTENLKLSGYDDSNMINLSYFEGSNLQREKSKRVVANIDSKVGTLLNERGD